MAHGLLFGGVTLLEYTVEIATLCTLALLWVVPMDRLLTRVLAALF